VLNAGLHGRAGNNAVMQKAAGHKATGLGRTVCKGAGLICRCVKTNPAWFRKSEVQRRLPVQEIFSYLGYTISL
jgi:hypothetical protein